MYPSVWQKMAVKIALAVGAVLAMTGTSAAHWPYWGLGPCCDPYVAVYRPVFFRPTFYRPVVYGPVFSRPWCCGTWSRAYWLDSCCDPVYGSWPVWSTDACCNGVSVGTTPAAASPQQAAPQTAPEKPQAASPTAPDTSVLTPGVDDASVTPPAGKAPAVQPKPAVVPPGDDTPPLRPSIKEFTPGGEDRTPVTPPKESLQTAKQSAILAVSVPEEARVYVNGIATQTPGHQRRYVSRGLVPGFPYTYTVRAEYPQQGRTVSETRTVQLRAGQTVEIAFAVPENTVQTTLTLHVPANAVVKLCGQATRATGTLRQFATHQLRQGQKWEDYGVEVSAELGGRQVTREARLTLVGGESREVTFEFAGEQLAQR
jgi:uncharacterized protein (TIGR03000 family)